MTSTSESAPAKAKSSMPDKLAGLAAFFLLPVGLSAISAGFEGTAEAYLRTVSAAACAITVGVVSLALRAAEKDR